MEEKRFHREDYPLDILAEFGLMEEMIYDLPEFVHETLERGGKSPLLPICVEQPFGVTHASAKFCLIETEEDLDVMFSPKLKSINLDAFSEEERQALLAGKVIVAEVEDKAVTDEGVEEMQRIQAFVQLDRDTNEGVSKFRYSLSSNYSKLFRVVYKGSLTHAKMFEYVFEYFVRSYIFSYDFAKIRQGVVEILAYEVAGKKGGKTILYPVY